MKTAPPVADKVVGIRSMTEDERVGMDAVLRQNPLYEVDLKDAGVIRVQDVELVKALFDAMINDKTVNVSVAVEKT